MGTPIHESIKAAVVFDHSSVIPAWFVWKGRRYPVRSVTQRWQTREGRTPILHLGVTYGATCFELTFNQDTLIWRLASVETEGIS